MAKINWVGMDPADIFESLAAAPRVVRWEKDVAFDPSGHQVAAVLPKGTIPGSDTIGYGRRQGYFMTRESADAWLRADGCLILEKGEPT